MRWLSCTSVFSALLMAGCATVPPLPVDGIAMGDIVQRVKCEIAFAVPDPKPPYPTGRYQWMRNWTAKVDLTLIANSRSAVTPSASFIDPLSKGTFTFGIGASLDTTAERTETLSFTLSLAEMREFRKRAECNLPNARHLYGNLGLREWLESALAPVDSGKLKVGRHPRPGAKSPPPPVVMPQLDLLRKEDPLAELKEARNAVLHYAKVATVALGTARDSAAKDLIQQTYDGAGLVYGAVIAAAGELNKVDRLASSLLKSEPHLKEEIESVQSEAKAAGKGIEKTKKDVDDIIGLLPRDPPIDSLSHSVRFVVAVSGSLSPNWALVNFKGPTTSGSLLSGAHTRTHTLSIAMGSAEEQVRALNNLVIIQNLRPIQ
jgi:hypothetical protein